MLIKTLIIILPCYLTLPERKVQCASVRITNAPKRRPSSAPQTNDPKNNVSSLDSKKPSLRSCLDPDFSPRSRTTQPDQPKIPRPSCACRPLAAQHRDKNLFFRALNHHSPSTPRRGPRAYHEIRRSPLRLVACVSSVVEYFSSIGEVASGPGPAWCVEGGGDGVRCTK